MMNAGGMSTAREMGMMGSSQQITREMLDKFKERLVNDH